MSDETLENMIENETNANGGDVQAENKIQITNIESLRKTFQYLAA